MTEEAKAKRGVGADTVQAVFGNVGDLVDGVAAEIGKLLGLQAAPHLLNGVQVVGVAWQLLDPELVTLASDPVAHASTVMRGQSVPDQHHRSLLFELVELGEKLDQGLIVVGTRTQLEHEMRIAAIGFVRECPGQGQPFPVEPMFEHWRVASGGPGRPHRRQQGHPRLVFKHNQRVLAPCPFFSCGQRCLTQPARAASFRSTARRAGRCRVQVN